MGKKDIISKHVLRHLAANIANLLLSLDIEDDSVELLSTEQQRIELRLTAMDGGNAGSAWSGEQQNALFLISLSSTSIFRDALKVGRGLLMWSSPY